MADTALNAAVEGNEPEAEPEAPAVALPSHEDLIQWFDEWEEKTRDSRKLARRDRDYYDGKQWTPDEVKELERRHQPVLTKNRIARKINFILGEEIRKRVDPVARPRTPQHEDSARAMTDALRFVEEQQGFDTARSKVLKNALIEGYGGALKEIEDTGEEFEHKLTHVEWDRLFYDPCSRAPDFSDGKFRGIVRWADLDDAIADYPDAEKALRESLTRDVGSADDTTEDTPRKWIDGKRKRVKIVEIYFRLGHDWYRCDFTKPAILRDPEKTAYLNESKTRSMCPLVMMSCYVDADGLRFGVVRDLVSPQDEINKRSSKALHLLSVYGVIREEGAIKDPQHFLEELAKPDSDAVVEPGALQSEHGPALIIRDGGQLAQGQLQLLQEAKLDIDTIGPSSSTLPDIPESASGRAFMARMQAASQELGTIFDQLRAWTRSVYELDYLCIRQYWTDEIWLRIADDDAEDGYRFTALNRKMTRADRFKELLEKQPAPKPAKALEIAAGNMARVIAAQAQREIAALSGGQQVPPEMLDQLMQQAIVRNPLMQDQITANQVDSMLHDIIVDEAPETAIIAQEQFDTLMELLPVVSQAKPDVAPTMVKLAIKASSLPDKRSLVQDLEKGPDPQAQALQKQVADLQMQLQKAQVALTAAQAQTLGAQAQKTQAETQAIVAKTPSEVQKNQASAQRDVSQARAAIEKTPSEVEKNHAQAMHSAASAGEKTSGVFHPGMERF